MLDKYDNIIIGLWTNWLFKMNTEYYVKAFSLNIEEARERATMVAYKLAEHFEHKARKLEK